MDVRLPPSELDLSDVEALRLEFVFRVRILFKERILFAPTTPSGGRVYVPPAGGDVFGPRLNGRMAPYSGADWARRHSDGASELNAHYMLEADDGTPIHIHNRGFLYGRGPDGPCRRGSPRTPRPRPRPRARPAEPSRRTPTSSARPCSTPRCARTTG